jgi:hypothetical protein
MSNKPIRTDGDIVRIARQMQQLLFKMQYLANEIEESDHPNKKQIIWDLHDNNIPPMAWPVHIIQDCLEHPEQWETGDFGIRYTGKTSLEQQGGQQ